MRLEDDTGNNETPGFDNCYILTEEVNTKPYLQEVF